MGDKQFDVSQYELLDSATLIVQTAKGDDDLIGADGVNPVTIDIYSAGSEQAVKASHKAAQAQNLRSMGLLRGKVDKRAGETADREEVERLVGITKAINNFPLSADTVYANTRLIYITKQVQKFFADDANFVRPSTTS